MFNIEKLSELSDLKKHYYISDARVRVSDNTLLLYVPREQVGVKVAPNLTSERQLHNIRKKLENKYCVNVEIIYTHSKSHESFELGCFEILSQRFKGTLSAFYMSFITDSTVDIWIAAEELTDDLKSDISSSVNVILAEANLNLRTIQWINPLFELPSAPYILKTIKISQPCTLKNLTQQISIDYPAINDKWLNKNLDKLRKKKFLSREKIGFYQLTELGLSILPTSTSSNSLDVQRALALGKRKW